MAENVYKVWSEGELDRALTTLHSEVDTDEHLLSQARAELTAAAGATLHQDITPRKHWARWSVAVAAVVVMVVGLLISQTLQFGGNPPKARAAVQSLNSAANKIHVSDPKVGPGQYRYVETHAWWLASLVDDEKKQGFAYLNENLLETWVPADQSQEWLLRRHATGARKWVVGTEKEARAAGFELNHADGAMDGERRARCGDFYADEGGNQPCTGTGGWEDPNPNSQWLAGLPRDPQQLYDRLRADAPSDKRSDAKLLGYAADALRSGLIPADLRAALYRALGMLPSLKITEKVANLDGRLGVAYGVNDDDRRQEIIIDPATGEFIGERETATKTVGKFKAGTVMSYSSVATVVVNSMGAKPTR